MRYPDEKSRLDEVIDGVRSLKMPRIGRGLAAGALALSLISGYGFMKHTTGTTEIGVRTKKVALIGTQGVQQDTYAPGSTYFFPRIINDWNTFDTRLQNVEMTATVDQGDKKGDDSLYFKTKDGNDLSIDVIFSYRIDPAKAPYILDHVANSDVELKEKIVRTVSRSRTRDLFGELTTEEFYAAPNRNAASDKAKAALQKILNPYGVIVENVSPKDYRFVSKEYAKAIKDKKLADGERLTILSKLDATREDNVRKLNEATGQVNEAVAKADADYKRAVLSSDAEYDKSKNVAAAIRQQGVNRAASIEKEREAMLSAGGKTMIKMQIAESLRGKPIYMVPLAQGSGALQLQTFDVNDYLKVRGLQGAAHGQAAPPAPHK